MLEALEDRRLLSTLDITGGALTYAADPTSASDLTVSIDPSDTADVIFTDADQLITLTGAGTGGWAGSGTNTATGPTSSYSSMAIGGSTTLGQSLTLDYTTGDPLPASGLTFTPAAATGIASNGLDLTSGNGNFPFVSQSYNPTAVGAGTITYTDSVNNLVPITFSNVSPLTDTVVSHSFIFNAPTGPTAVNVIDGPSGTTEINDGGSGSFEQIDLANQAIVMTNVVTIATLTTIDTINASAGLMQLYAFSNNRDDQIDVEATPSGVTTTADVGSDAGGNTINVGYFGTLTSILGPVDINSEYAPDAVNAIDIDDSRETTAQTYTFANSTLMASSISSPISLDPGSNGLMTLALHTPAGSTINLDGLDQWAGVTEYNFYCETGSGPNILNVTSEVPTLNYGTDSLSFGANEPGINYLNLQTINVVKPATPPVGTPTTISGVAGQTLNNATVATFTDPDLANIANGFVASINWGDSTTSAGTITANGIGVYDITGNHTYAANGSYAVDVTLTDQGTSGSATASGTTINVTSQGPVSATPDPIDSTADISPTLLPNSLYDFMGLGIDAVQDVETTQDIATFRSYDTTAVPSDFTATINWGDFVATPGTITEDASTPGIFDVSGTHTYTTAGSFTPTVTIKDINGTVYATGALYQTNLVSSVFGDAAEQDTNLINPWGQQLGGTGIQPSDDIAITVSDQGSSVSTVYQPNSSPITQSTVITVPASGPTGIVGNHDPLGFVVPSSTTPTSVLFDTLGGTIAAWATGSSATTTATVAGAMFTGLAQGTVANGSTNTYYLYATDFAGTTGSNGIDVFDSTFTNVSGTTFAGKFADPNIPAGFKPFDIALLNGDLFVTYALPSGTSSITGKGGYIDEFDTSGNLLKTIASDPAGTNLNGPWGLDLASAYFGSYAGDLLVGNFGGASGTSPDGTIVAINLNTDTVVGPIVGANGAPIINPGLWGLSFDYGGIPVVGNPGELYLTAGIDSQTQGLLAGITVASTPVVTVAAAPAPLTATGTTIRGTEGLPLTTSSAGVVVATLTDTGNPGAPSVYTITIDWGDGTTSNGTITDDGSVYNVIGNHTYYGVGTYPVTVTITNTADGAAAVASSQAVITPMLIADTPPVINVPERVIFDGTVAEFTDPNPTATPDVFSALIDWGDGSPQSAGIITLASSTATSTTFLISGMHTYADLFQRAGSAIQPAAEFPMVINVVGTDGSSINLTNTATVLGQAFTVSGLLDPSSDSGISDSDDITNVTLPKFDGTASEPFAKISVYAGPQGPTTTTGATLLGTTTADSIGAWSLTSNVPLINGAYTITALAVDATNSAITTTGTVVFYLNIDTVGPKVTGVAFERLRGQIVVTYQDFGSTANAGSGVDAASLIDANNYQLTTVHHPRVGKYRVDVISDVPGTNSGTQFVTLSINGGQSIRGKWYFFTIFSASPSNPSGVQDVAGNALDGEFYGYFPSGNNVPGGNFVAQLTAMHHTIFAPSTIIGRATPVHPPGTRQGKVTAPGTDDPSKRHGSSSLGSARSRSPQKGTRVVHHSDPTIASSSRAKVPRQAVAKVVHHKDPALTHPSVRVGRPGAASSTSSSTSRQDTAMGALGTLDQALDQLGGAKHPKS